MGYIELTATVRTPWMHDLHVLLKLVNGTAHDATRATLVFSMAVCSMGMCHVVVV